MLRARYIRIILFFARVLLGLIVWDLIFPRLGLRSYTLRTRPGRLRKYSIAFRGLAVQMGGLMIKVGQFLSARVDVLPTEVTEELQGLQDEVPPESVSDIRLVAESEFGVPLEVKFSTFEDTPLAAASLGQVHRAWLHEPPDIPLESGKKSWGVGVVVKIQRPGIERIIATDLAALRTVGSWLNRYKPIRRRVNVSDLLDEFSRVVYEEIDYLAEGNNADIFAENFKDYKGVRVPQVVWTHTTKRVLTLENVWAIKITDYAAITHAGIRREEVASRLLDAYLKQIFEDGFFHADPHPGNLFVHPLTDQANPEWELTFVDFGMVGHVPPNLRHGLRDMLIGIGTQDTTRMVNSIQEMDMLLPSADLDLLERMIARELELFWGKTMTEMSNISFDELRDFADEFRDMIYDLPFQVPQNVIFLGRCVGILSGMCTGLDPNFNVWDHLAPFAQKLVSEDARGSIETLLGELEKIVRALILIPLKMDSTLSKLERGEIAVRTPDMERQMQHLEIAIRQVTGGIIFAALLLGSIQLYLGGEILLGGILIILAAACFFWLLFSGRFLR